MSFASNRVATTTTINLLPKVVDTILNSNVFAGRMLRSSEKWSGERIRIPIKYQTNTTGQSFAGFDTFSTAASNTRANMEYQPKFYQITVALPLDELSTNMTDAQIIDLAAVEMKSSAQDMADGIGTLFYSDGTGNGGKDFLGLGAIVDDGTSVDSIGGLSRATYPTLDSTVTASSGTLSLAKMSTLYNAISSGSVTPTLGLVTEVVYALYESLLQPQERIVKDVPLMKGKVSGGLNAGTGLIGGTGYTGLYYKGFPVLADEKTTSGTMFFLNENFINWYALPVFGTEAVKYKSVDIQGNDYSDVMGLGFSWSGWIKPVNSASVIGHIYLGGELTTDDPKRHGKLTGITAV